MWKAEILDMQRNLKIAVITDPYQTKIHISGVIKDTAPTQNARST